VRVKCLNCGATHAIIPAFSLPGTSIGTKEAEEYIKSRKNNISRQEAAEILVSKGIRGEGYPKYFDKAFNNAVNKAKAIFTEYGDHTLKGLDWLESVIGKCSEPITLFNMFCLSHNINCIFFIRSNAIIFKVNKSKIKSSLNMVSNFYSDKGINSS
jgi:hypothetical protein